MRIKGRVILLFLGPAIAVFLAVFLYPTLRSVIMSFYNVPALSSRFQEWKIVGLRNYMDLFRSPYFMASVRNVAGIWVFGGALIFSFSFLLAAIITSGVRGKGFWRSLVYLPNTVSAVVMSIVWLQYIYNPTFGLLTTAFRNLGLESLAGVQWTDDYHLYGSMIAAYSFGSIGYFMLIFIAAIDRIPVDFHEAAFLEGAGGVRRFFSITLPLLRDVFRTTLVLWTMTAANFFVWSATFGLDSPFTVTPGYYMYQKVFGFGAKGVYIESNFNVGSGAGVGVLITIAVVLGSLGLTRLFPRERLEY
jgi:ABC-type sugar transport system permease subunit